MPGSKVLSPHELAPMWAKNLMPRKYQRGTKEKRVSVWWNRWWWWLLQFSFYWLADFSLADTPQDRISGRMYVRFLSGWQTVCAAFSKKGTLEKFDNPAICLSDPQIASGASEPLAAVAKATAKYSSYQSRQRHRNTESLQRKQYNRKMMEN